MQGWNEVLGSWSIQWKCSLTRMTRATRLGHESLWQAWHLEMLTREKYQAWDKGFGMWATMRPYANYLSSLVLFYPPSTSPNGLQKPFNSVRKDTRRVLSLREKDREIKYILAKNQPSRGKGKAHKALFFKSKMCFNYKSNFTLWEENNP